MVATMGIVRAEDVVRDAIASDQPASAHQAWLEDAVACVRRHGVIVIRDAIPKDVVGAVLEDFKVRHDLHMTPGQKKLYRRFQGDPLRAQLPTAVDGPLADPRYFAPPSALALAKTLLGEDLIIGEMGVVISHPGAGAQETHRDSAFLFGGLDMEIDLPPYAMTMLTPLVDVELDMGPTEFWPGTHRLFEADAKAAAGAAPPARVALTAGSLVFIDARLMHRGGANISGPVRPTTYFSYHRRWYQEHGGYEKKPQVTVTPAMLQRLPEAYRPLFEWALHLNRTSSLEELAHRWIGRILRRLGR